MSLIKKVIKAVKKLFKVSFKKPRKSKKPSRKVKQKPKVQKSSTPRKTVKPAVKKPQPQKSSRPAKTVPRKSTPASIQKNVKSVQEKPVDISQQIGEVTHYFNKIKVCVIRIDRGTIKKGDQLVIKGKNGSLNQKVVSMQIENEDVAVARKGQLIGLRVTKEVYVGDSVGKL